MIVNPQEKIAAEMTTYSSARGDQRPGAYARRRRQAGFIARVHRRRSGNVLVSAMWIGSVVSLWMMGMYSYLETVIRANISDRARIIARDTCESSIEWAVDQLASGNTAIDCTTYQGSPTVTAVPSSVLTAMAPNVSVSANVYVWNLQPSSTSYLYDSTVAYDPSGTLNNGVSKNYWRVVGVKATCGGILRTVRVVLRPYMPVTTGSSTSSSGGTVPMFSVNSLTVSGSGNITGNVATNTKMNLSGSNNVNGNITAAGPLTISGSSTINGNIQTLGALTLNSNVNGFVTSTSTITTGASTSVGGDMSAGGNITAASSTSVTGNVRTSGTFTSSGSYTQIGSSTGGNLTADGGVNASSGSFSMAKGGASSVGVYTMGNVNTGWGQVTGGQLYYGGSNQSPSYSWGATAGNSTPILASNTQYVSENASLSASLSAAQTAAAATTFAPPPSPPSGATTLSSAYFTSSGSNSINLAGGDYILPGNISLSGSNTINITSGTVRLWLNPNTSGNTPVINMSGSNTVNIYNSDPHSFQVYTSSSQPINFSGSTNIAFGYLYAPNSAVTLSGSNNMQVGGLVAASVTESGSSSAVQMASSSSNPLSSLILSTNTTSSVTFSNWQVVSYQEQASW